MLRAGGRARSARSWSSWTPRAIAAGSRRAARRRWRAAEPSRVVRLLPGFDPYVIGALRQLDRLVPAPEHQAAVSRASGWISPVLLDGGRIAGTWTQEVTGGRLAIEITPFGRLRRGVRAAAEAEAARWAAYAAAPSTSPGPPTDPTSGRRRQPRPRRQQPRGPGDGLVPTGRGSWGGRPAGRSSGTPSSSSSSPARLPRSGASPGSGTCQRKPLGLPARVGDPVHPLRHRRAGVLQLAVAVLVDRAERLVHLDELTVRQPLDDAGLDAVLEHLAVVPLQAEAEPVRRRSRRSAAGRAARSGRSTSSR